MMNLSYWGHSLDAPRHNAPRYNVEDLGDSRYRVSMTVPGFNESNLQVSVRDDVLSIRGRLNAENGKGDEAADNRERYLRRGYVESEFERSFTLDEGTEVDGATLQDGILRIELSRREPEPSKERLVEIKRA